MLERCAILIPIGRSAPERSAVDAHIGHADALARSLVRPGGRIDLIGWRRPDAWHLGDIWSTLDADLDAADGALQHAVDALQRAGFAGRSRLQLSDEVPLDAVPEEAEAVLVPAGPLDEAARVATEALLEAGRAVVWSRGAPLATPAHAVVAYSGDPRRTLPAIELLRPRAHRGDRLTLLRIAVGRTPSVTPDAMPDLLGWPGPVAVGHLGGAITALPETLAGWLEAREAGLLVVPLPATSIARSIALRLLATVEHPAAAVLLPPAALAPYEERRIDATDGLVLGDRALLRIDQLDGFGAVRRLPDGPLSVIIEGETRSEGRVRDGRLMLPLPPGRAPAAIGVALAGRSLGGMAAAVHLLRPGGAVALLDAHHPLPAEALAVDGEPLRWWAVRLDASRPAGDLRATWAGATEGVIDAGLVLDDGDPPDLPTEAHPIRLLRVARRLRLAGVRVALTLAAGDDHGGLALPPDEWLGLDPAARGRRLAEGRASAASGSAALSVLTGAQGVTATRLDVEFDNGAARRRFLALLDGARERIWLQSYIFESDAVASSIASALRRAAARGVEVRVLIDALFSQHDALGQKNPALLTLEHDPNVALRVIRPFTVPDLADLKQRDHRKLLIVDHRIGRITGRNIGGPYYTGFDEVPLSAETSYRDVPWLDVGAELEGPIVAAFAAAFARHWRRAGGEVLPCPTPGPAGPIAAHLVLHESMRDAHTLDAYRWLIDTARRRVVLVNTFPLQFELQRALLAARRRGVEVRFLVGHVRPLHGAERTPFVGGAFRALATEVIHGRLDALLAAGAEARGFAIAGHPRWTVNDVLPHVHAKLASVDGERLAIGSANLDITAGYWESEALLIVDDRAATGAVDEVLDRLWATAAVIDDDPSWAATAARRAWISRNWPSVLG